MRWTLLCVLMLSAIAVHAQKQCHLLPNPLAALLPGNSDTRLAKAFEHEPLMGVDKSNTTLQLLAAHDPWIEQVLAIHTEESLANALDAFPDPAVGWRDAHGATVDSPVDQEDILKRLHTQHSVVIKRELSLEPESCLQRSLQQQLLTEVTAHLYISGGEALALQVSQSNSCCPSVYDT